MAQSPDASVALDLGYRGLLELRTDHGFDASDRASGTYAALFGRDSIWILLLLLEAVRIAEQPSVVALAEDAGALTLSSLARIQGDRFDDSVEEQPGKIVHEFRREMDERLTQMGIPFREGRSYAGFDQTFLFVTAYRRYCSAYPMSAVGEALWPAVARAIQWMTLHADRDTRGFFAYRRRDPRNLRNQVWKDSFDSLVAHGIDVPDGPVAWIEVQAYAYRAMKDATELCIARGETTIAGPLNAEAEELQARVEASFWLEDESCYALALDAKGGPIPLVASNAGHTLWTGLTGGVRIARLADRLMRPDLMTEYGIRTLSSASAVYDPFSYHRGSIWPFDNAVVALGLAACGELDKAQRVASSVCRAVISAGSPVELYCVLDGASLLQPATTTAQVLALRSYPPVNRLQGWTAAALIYFSALLTAAP